MDNSHLLIAAMARQCKERIRMWAKYEPNLPPPLQPYHLEWMCDQIENHADSRSATRLHRWIGFVQAAMLAHGMLDLTGLKSMFDEAKRDHGETAEDMEDLMDHLDPRTAFELDIGGEA